MKILHTVRLLNPIPFRLPNSYTRDAAGFSNLGGLALIRWAKSAPLVVIGITELQKAHPAQPLAASLQYKSMVTVCTMYILQRGVNSYIKLGGQLVMLPGGAFYCTKSLVGNCPLCLPVIYAPATHRQERGVSESSGSINSFCFCHPFMLQQK